MWVREIFRNREKYGTLNLVREAAMADEEMFFRYMRMSPRNFEYLDAAQMAEWYGASVS